MEERKLSVVDKYRFYEEAVQNPEGEVETLQDLYFSIRKKKAKVLREDFCGTGAIMCNWVKQGDDYLSIGIDLDPEPVDYGKEYHKGKLTEDQQRRVKYILEDVFTCNTEKADLIMALNFSYYIFSYFIQTLYQYTCIVMNFQLFEILSHNTKIIPD